MRNVIDSIEKKYRSKIIFSYKGSPSPDMIHGIMHLAEGKLEWMEPEKKTRKKVFKIMVELLQNIRHQVENLDEVWFPSFVFYIIRETDHYTMISCNRQLEERIRVAAERINGYLALSAGGRRKAYRDILGNGRFSAKGGAGLGFLEIIRSSKGNFNYHIFPSEDPGHKLFCLEIKIY